MIGELPVLRAVDGDHPDIAPGAIRIQIGCGERVGDLAAVGRESDVGNPLRSIQVFDLQWPLRLRSGGYRQRDCEREKNPGGSGGCVRGVGDANSDHGHF
jgi:hypothetical protein